MLSIIQKTHKDRFRKIFCDQDFYKLNQNIFKMWKTRFAPLSNVEKVQAWVLGLTCLRRPNDWYGGKRQNIFLNETTALRHSLSLAQLFSDTPVQIPPKLNAKTNLIDCINIFKIKAFPESCNRSLCYISNKRYPLIITEKIPSPQELLQIQITGQRIITINEDVTSWPMTYYSGRDFLGFIMHDLIHADHFFLDPEHRDGQLGFFKFVENILIDKNLNDFLLSESFKTGFEYIISDMNSHPVHLFQTLHALLFTEAKNDILATTCWYDWVHKSKLTSDEARSALLVNSDSFNDTHAKTLELLCIRLGKQIST